MVELMYKRLQSLRVRCCSTVYRFGDADNVVYVVAVAKRFSVGYTTYERHAPLVRCQHKRCGYAVDHRKMRLLVTSNDPSLSNSISA